MSKPKILIIGCGAVGLSQGYHLSSAAEITYLVRPNRTPAFAPPKNLYDYKTDTLHTFSSYRVIESTSAVAGEQFFCVFDTLDGHAARSENGVATLKAVGDLIRDSPSTFVMYDAVGTDMEQHYASSMNIEKTRLVLAVSMLAHQPTGMISVPPSANGELVAKANLLYAYLGSGIGLLVVGARPEIMKKIENVYHPNGRLKVQRLPGAVGNLTLMILPQLIAWHLEGWAAWPQLKQSGETWELLLRAQKEVLNFPRFGWLGKVLSWFVGSWVTTKIIEGLGKDSEPLLFHEFNAFHHGGKVILQDVEVLEDIIEEGEKAKRDVTALKEMCRRARKTLEK